MVRTGRIVLVAFSLIAASCGCKKPQPAQPAAPPGEVPVVAVDAGPPPAPVAAPRKALLDPKDPNFGRFEGTDFQNACGTDADCKPSGCAGEVCAAENVVSTCDVLPKKPDGNCGCLEGLCQWYTGGAATPAPAP